MRGSARGCRPAKTQKFFSGRQSVSSRMQGRGGPARAMGGLRDSFVGHTLTEQTLYGMLLALGLHNAYYV